MDFRSTFGQTRFLPRLLQGLLHARAQAHMNYFKHIHTHGHPSASAHRHFSAQAHTSRAKRHTPAQVHRDCFEHTRRHPSESAHRHFSAEAHTSRAKRHTPAQVHMDCFEHTRGHTSAQAPHILAEAHLPVTVDATTLYPGRRAWDTFNVASLVTFPQCTRPSGTSGVRSSGVPCAPAHQTQAEPESSNIGRTKIGELKQASQRCATAIVRTPCRLWDFMVCQNCARQRMLGSRKETKPRASGLAAAVMCFA
eukprot:1156146-Pelagomonas_calceolata.AAC.3